MALSRAFQNLPAFDVPGSAASFGFLRHTSRLLRDEMRRVSFLPLRPRRTCMRLANGSVAGSRCVLALLAVLVGGLFHAEVHAGATTFTVTNQGLGAYVIDGQANAPLQLTRGETYTFNLNAPGHPFLLKTVQGNGVGNQYTSGVTGNGTQTGTLTFSVPLDAPNTLFYNCEFHFSMTGTITVVNGDPIFGDGFE